MSAIDSAELSISWLSPSFQAPLALDAVLDAALCTPLPEDIDGLDLLEGTLHDAASTETLKAASSPSVDLTSAGEPVETDVEAVRIPEPSVTLGTQSAPGPTDKHERPIIKVDFFAALVNFTADDDPEDDEVHALHAALDADRLRNNVQINHLNRLIDELEADKVRLTSVIDDLEAKRSLDAERISALSADMHAVNGERSELRGALSGMKTAYEAAQLKLEADKTRIAELRAKHMAAENQLQRLRHEQQDAQNMISTLKTTIDDHKAALEDAQARNQGLHSQLYEEREIAMATKDHLAAVQNAAVELKGQLEEQTACARDAVARQEELQATLEDVRLSLADFHARAAFLEEQATEAAEAYDALYRDKEALSRELYDQTANARKTHVELVAAGRQNSALEAELVSTKTALLASEDRNAELKTQLQDERNAALTQIAVVEEKAQHRIAQQEARHQEELAAVKHHARTTEDELKATIARLEDRLSQTNTVLNHVLVQASVLAEQEEIYLSTQAALAKEQWISARKSDDIKRLRRENIALAEQLKAAQHTSFKLDEELGSLITRVNAASEEKRAVEEQLAEKSAIVEELQAVNQRMGSQMEDLREDLASLYEEQEATRSQTEVSIDEVRQLKNDFEEQTCATLESVLGEKEQLRAEKKAAEKELVRVRRESKAKLDALEKDNSELRIALQKKPQAAELHEAKKLVGVYTERIANCTQCKVTSTPAARFKTRGKENAGGADDSFFGSGAAGVDSILSNLSFFPRSPLSTSVNF